MANPSVVWLQLPAGVSNGVALAQAPGVAGNLTLNGSLASAGVATLTAGITTNGNPAQRIGIHSTSGSDSARVFSVTGTNRNGGTQSETITGVTTATVDSALDYATVTRVAIDGAAVGNIIVGTVGIGSTDWIADDFFVAPFELSLAATVVSGTANYSAERTYDDPNKFPGTSLVLGPQQFSMEAAGFVPPRAWGVPEMSGLTASAEANMSAKPCLAHRLTINSGTGLVVLQSIQAGSPRI